MYNESIADRTLGITVNAVAEQAVGRPNVDFGNAFGGRIEALLGRTDTLCDALAPSIDVTVSLFV